MVYEGDVGIDGVLGMVVLVMIDFLDVVGLFCGVLFFFGNIIDIIDGIMVICVDNGMLVVMLYVVLVGVIGNEILVEFEVRIDIKVKVEVICL